LANYTAKQKILDQMKAMFDGDETEDGLKILGI